MQNPMDGRMLLYVFVFIVVILAMISMYLAGLLGGVPYAYKVITAKEYNHYTTYKDGHAKVLRKNKKLVREQAFRDAMKIFQGEGGWWSNIGLDFRKVL